MHKSDTIKKLINDFVFLDCRLGSHPKVKAFLRRVEGEYLVCVATSSGMELKRSEKPLKISQGVPGLVYREKDAFALRGASFGEWHNIYIPVEPMIKSELVLPLPGQFGPTGILGFESIESNAFKPEHMGRAQILAALVQYIEALPGPMKGKKSHLSEQIGSALRNVREELKLTQTQVASLSSTSRIALSRWEAGAQPPSVGPLWRWCESLGLLSPSLASIVTTIDITTRLLPILKREPERLSELTPAQFESFVAERIDIMGFDVKITGASTAKDGGIDIIAIPRVPGLASYLMAIQVKHHAGSRKTGRPDVDRLLAWKDSPFRIGLLVTNTSFTRDAMWAAALNQNKAFLRLRDFDDLRRWIQGTFWAEEEWREIPNSISLAPGITIEIPRPNLKDWSTIWPLRKIELSHEDDSV